ncbi:Glu/Leu/Phe/Val dehydrogenase dimerization domain-containing protein [Haliangium ochraceum]|uniref:Glu/Leu/Phe/Val dehydrogenase dimerization region n=1 Tax=Haliangium ochraceum (strain DSM 14365 / JCM 11303 / SMP-2) TaxID=502025 RepID=D0LYN2_HALO1|nr:Glu/Leu/Phe/Val dehydrogenase dimerization domain-containing protein [Haliangium ochraceum]ACY17898.1 Glu/Leu/Phe/Val dehydrogenase dimerization region [Haliangium ochraceum DSM 14365]
MESPNIFSQLQAHDTARCFLFSDPASGLRAVVVIDDLTLGPAAGGTRTHAYPSLDHALADAAALARAMTIKCALAEIPAGGAKAVIIDHPGLRRVRAFARFGTFVEELGGIFRTAGDLGTTRDDLANMAEYTRYVTIDESGLAQATARSVLRGIEACADVAGRGDVSGLRVAVQGCGMIGRAVAEALAAAGARLMVADLDEARARAVAERTGAEWVAADDILAAECDVLSPCALGGVLTGAVADGIRAWAVCGAANNQLGERVAEQRLRERRILFVPDVIASAGAVVHGILREHSSTRDTGRPIDRLGDIARQVLAQSLEDDASPTELTHELARARLREARRVNDSVPDPHTLPPD